MINSTIITVKGLIEELDNYLADMPIEPTENYLIAELQRIILVDTLNQLKKTQI